MSLLSEPARYFPIRNGRYEVSPGLRPLGAPFGNGAADARLFQIDRQFPIYRENKRRCRSERLDKYLVTRDYAAPVACVVARTLAERFCVEYPDLFIREREPGGSVVLRCRLTGEDLAFDPEGELTGVASGEDLAPPYASALDALACQIPEDIAVVCTAPDGRDWIAALHLCSPSHWGAEQKIGRSFAAAHAPIPGMERTIAASASLVEAMIRRGPFVRFVWGVGADDRLNHHPDPPPGISPEQWRGRVFDPSAPDSPFFLRVERQCLLGLPEVGAAVFTIRVYFIAGSEIRAIPEERAQLRSALLSMSPESLRYKGVAADRDSLLAWLAQPSQ